MSDHTSSPTSPKSRRSPLMLCHYLSPSSILLETGGADKTSFLNQMIERLISVHHLTDGKKIMQAVWDRENEGRTVLENGLAIPHARITGIESIKACLGILPQGYEDPLEKVVVKVVFLFLSPQDQFDVHLQMLAKISRVFQDMNFLDALIQTASPEEAFDLLQRQERG